ncbi:E3 ubiquitin-protein ligase parkin [Blattella germanica]|nr:E3 ubiquitin-protein ligase parkin [Blattella germanica]
MSFIIEFFTKLIQSMLQVLSFGKRTISNSLSVYIKTNTGNTLSMDLDPKWDIKNVKELVAPRLGLTPDEVKIIFAGKELDDSIVIEGRTEEDGPKFAEFYFKCAEHTSQGEEDQAVPLHLIKSNIRNIPCLACTDISDPVLVFPCDMGHVTCLECFRAYCITRLRERQFWSHPEYGYTLPCPAGCRDSLISEVHHFRLLTQAQYAQYQKFGTEDYVLQAGGVLCPQPGCGMGILADPDCRRITCIAGCGFVFCRQCLQGYHIGDCVTGSGTATSEGDCQYNVDPSRAAQARWDDASHVAIRVTTKPCPKCRTPTERAGGCMHMVCTRPQCNFHWCWICQTEWSRECMGNHWFG